MFFPVKMKKLSVITAAEYADGVTRVLLNAGTVDLNEPKDYYRWQGVRRRDVEIPQDRVREIRSRIEGFLAMADESPAGGGELTAEAMEPVEPEKCDRLLDKLAAGLQQIRDQQKNLQQELFQKEELREQLEQMPAMARGLVPGDSVYIRIHTGSLKTIHQAAFFKALEGLTTLSKWEAQDDRRIFVVLVALKREEKALDSLMERFQWESHSLPPEAAASPESLLAELEEQIRTIRDQQKKMADQGKELIRSRREELAALWRNVRVNELFDRVQLEFGETGRTILFTGWVPARSADRVEGALREAASDNIFLQWHEVRDLDSISRENVPVELDNPKLLKPFQLVVENYSLPRYGTVDPTPFTAVSFFLMFGLMFGDAGQGLVILALGLAGSRYFRKEPRKQRLLQLIAWCGVSAVLFGTLFGSWFGYPLLPPLWFDYHGVVAGHGSSENLISSVYDILGITIRFGICVIYIGLILNWVNLIRKRDWLSLVLDRTGLLGGWIYGAGIYTAWTFVASDYQVMPPAELLGAILGLPVLLLGIKEPLELILERKQFRPGMILDWFMEWVVQLLETFSGYLSNTLSFMRVAGLGIAHVSLMTAFAEMAGLTDSVIFRFLILLAGNILVIALEGLSAGIQSLRLNYYEFFSKYFSGSGRAFAPVSLGRRNLQEE